MDKDKVLLEEVDRLIKSSLEIKANNENVEKYWANFKRFLKILGEAKEALREAHDCSYSLGEESIRQVIREVVNDFDKIYEKVDSERDRINKFRYTPLKLEQVKVDEDKNIKAEPVEKEISPVINREIQNLK